MRMKALLAAALMLIGTAGMASAADQAWFDVVGSTGCANLIGWSAGPGQVLKIDKDAGPPGTRCELEIGYFATYSQYGIPGGSYAVSLWTADTKLSVKAVNQAAGDALGYTAHFGGVGAPPMLLNNVSAIAPAGNGGEGLLFTFTLSIQKDGIPGQQDIYGDWGQTWQTYSNGWKFYGQLGPNAIGYGADNYPGNDMSLPVITINKIPEPATLALLGIGGLCLLRRRR